MITEEDKQIALDCLKSVLALIHERRYKELGTVVDEIHHDRLDEILEFIEESIYPYVIDGFDPEVEYYMQESKEQKRLWLEYPLTSCGVTIFGILFMVFEYTDNGVVKIIDTIEAD